MRAVVIRAFGGPCELKLADISPPPCGPGQVLIRVRACGVGFGDLLMCQGRYPLPVSFPFTPGIEVSGTVEQVGEGVLGIAAGNRVMAVTLAGGGYAEQVTVPANTVFPLPEHAAWEEGAAFLIPFLTAYVPLRWQVRLEPNSTVLVLAAAGGVGSSAVQVARSMGAQVIAAAGSEEKLAIARRLGAAGAVNYTRADWVQQVLAITGEQGVDVVFDPVGGKMLEEALKAVRPLGAAVAVGYAGGDWMPVDVQKLVGRNIGVHGLFLGRLFRHRPDVIRDAWQDLSELWLRQEIHSQVGGAYPLEQAGHVHALMEARQTAGKIVLQV